MTMYFYSIDLSDMILANDIRDRIFLDIGHRALEHPAPNGSIPQLVSKTGSQDSVENLYIYLSGNEWVIDFPVIYRFYNGTIQRNFLGLLYQKGVQKTHKIEGLF